MIKTESKETKHYYQKTNQNIGLTKIKGKVILVKSLNYCKWLIVT